MSILLTIKYFIKINNQTIYNEIINGFSWIFKQSVLFYLPLYTNTHGIYIIYNMGSIWFNLNF
jgi:hypothetical protein